MKRIQTTILWFAAIMLLLAFAANVACAATVKVTVTSVSTNLTAAGWRRAVRGTGSKGGLTYYGAYGNPGPAPIGHYYLQDGYTYGTAGEGQSWLGTNDYSGKNLSDITTLKYWAWLEKRGPEFQGYTYCMPPECEGSNVETGPKWWPSQPPKPVLIIVKNGTGTDLRTLQFRPWGFVGDAGGLGAAGGTKMRKWRQYDCLADADEGVWYVCWDNTDLPSFTGSWADILSYYPNAKIADQSVIPPPPTSAPWDLHTSLVDAGVNFQLGALATYNSDMDPWAIPGYLWWQESYNAKGAVDLITIGVSGNETIYDFDSPSYLYRVLGTSNLGLIGANFNYCKWEPPSSSEYTCLMSATQRAAVNNSVKFVIWGTVSTEFPPDNGAFWVSDGASQLIECYCNGNTLAGGEPVRVAGFYAAPTPYDWGTWYEAECDCKELPYKPACKNWPHHWFIPMHTPVLNTYSWDILPL